jgi:stage II sporulation protein AB (anti-sigma F factor)
VELSLRLDLAAVAEGIPRARGAITELCDDLGITGDLRDRIRLATTEACTNCVVHAYGAGPAEPTFRIDAHVETHALVIVVRDRGGGIFGERRARREDAGRGIPLIDLIADSAHLWSQPGEGTRITMRFGLQRPFAAHRIAV